MSAVETLEAARSAGVSVGIDGGDLVLQASAPAPPAVLAALSRHKAAIVARSGRFAELPSSSKTCAKLRSSRLPPNAGAASSAKHSSSISTA